MYQTIRGFVYPEAVVYIFIRQLLQEVSYDESSSFPSHRISPEIRYHPVGRHDVPWLHCRDLAFLRSPGQLCGCGHSAFSSCCGHCPSHGPASAPGAVCPGSVYSTACLPASAGFLESFFLFLCVCGFHGRLGRRRMAGFKSRSFLRDLFPSGAVPVLAAAHRGRRVQFANLFARFGHADPHQAGRSADDLSISCRYFDFVI